MPKPEAPVPFLNFAPLQNASVRLQESAASYDRAMGEAAARGRLISSETQKALDEILIRTERAMTRSAGLPRRPWFKHQIYAPGFYTGYGVKTLPGIREAIEQRNWKEANEQVEMVVQTIERVADEIDRAAKLIKASMPH